MEINKEILLDKIDFYRSNKISRNELGEWAKEAYYDLMKGEYIEIEKISLYHFLREISLFHIEANDITGEYPCSEERIFEIGEIVAGRKNTQYTFYAKISKLVLLNNFQIRYNKFKKMQEMICILNSEKIPLEILCFFKEYVNQDTNEIQTLIDLFEAHIRGILIENIDFGESSVFDYCRSLRIYAGDVTIDRITFITNLKKLLECILGERGFGISILYNKGIPNTILVL